jgi:hypothetical protein
MAVDAAAGRACLRRPTRDAASRRSPVTSRLLVRSGAVKTRPFIDRRRISARMGRRAHELDAPMPQAAPPEALGRIIVMACNRDATELLMHQPWRPPCSSVTQPLGRHSRPVALHRPARHFGALCPHLAPQIGGTIPILVAALLGSNSGHWPSPPERAHMASCRRYTSGIAHHQGAFASESAAVRSLKRGRAIRPYSVSQYAEEHSRDLSGPSSTMPKSHDSWGPVGLSHHMFWMSDHHLPRLCYLSDIPRWGFNMVSLIGRVSCGSPSVKSA